MHWPEINTDYKWTSQIYCRQTGLKSIPFCKATEHQHQLRDFSMGPYLLSQQYVNKPRNTHTFSGLQGNINTGSFLDLWIADLQNRQNHKKEKQKKWGRKKRGRERKGEVQKGRGIIRWRNKSRIKKEEYLITHYVLQNESKFLSSQWGESVNNAVTGLLTISLDQESASTGVATS